MLAPAEQRFYFWATSEWMQDEGAVVDLAATSVDPPPGWRRVTSTLAIRA